MSDLRSRQEACGDQRQRAAGQAARARDGAGDTAGDGAGSAARAGALRPVPARPPAASFPRDGAVHGRPGLRGCRGRRGNGGAGLRDGGTVRGRGKGRQGAPQVFDAGRRVRPGVRPEVPGLGLGELTGGAFAGERQGVLVAQPVQLGPQRVRVDRVLLCLGRRRGADFLLIGWEGALSRKPAASRSSTGMSQSRSPSSTAPGSSPASRRRRIVVRLTPHAAAASRRASRGREVLTLRIVPGRRLCSKSP